jgi:hypothetical protein
MLCRNTLAPEMLWDDPHVVKDNTGLGIAGYRG